MYDVAESLQGALGTAQGALGRSAISSALSETPLSAARSDAAMAGAARSAIFEEALLNAVHARLAEIKSVTHG